MQSINKNNLFLFSSFLSGICKNNFELFEFNNNNYQQNIF